MLKLIRHNIWDIHDQGYTICICTNGIVTKSGAAVMGRGLALEAKQRFPKFEYEFGQKLKKTGNVVNWFPTHRVFTFPTKHHWREDSDPSLMRESCKSLKEWSTQRGVRLLRGVIFLPIPGIGNGKLDKKIVMPILEEELGDAKHIVIVEKP